MIDSKMVQKLLDIAYAAVSYVGSANYPEREEAANEALRKAYTAAIKGDVDNVCFRPVLRD